MGKEPLEDITKMLGGAMSTLGTLRQEGEQMFREQMQHFLGKMDLVRREEFEVLQDRLRLLETRLAALEAVASPNASADEMEKSSGSGKVHEKGRKKAP